MKYKLLWMPVLFILVLPLSFAVTEEDLDNGLSAYWDLDTDGTDQLGRNDWTANAGTVFLDGTSTGLTACERGGCINITGNGNRGIYDDSLTGWDTSTDEFSIDCVFSFNNIDIGYKSFIAGQEDGTWMVFYDVGACGTDKVCTWASSGSGWDIINEDAAGSFTGWVNSDRYHLLVGRNSSSYYVYLNGAEDMAEHDATDLVELTEFHFGDSVGAGAGNTFLGTIDECAFWNRSLSVQERQFRYNNGDIRVATDGSFAPLAPPVINITAKDEYDASALTNFSILIYNSTYSSTNSTSSGGIAFGNLGGFMNINISSNQSGGYFNKSYLNVNVSSDFEAQLYQAILHVNATEIISGDVVEDFFVSVPLQSNQSQIIATLLLKAGSYTITGNKTGYFNATETTSISALETKTISLEFFRSLLNVSATSITEGALSSFTIDLSDESRSYTKTKNTTEGYILFNLIDGNYNLSFSASNQGSHAASVNINTSNIYPNYTFSIYALNSFNFTFLDEQTGLLIDKDINVELISNVSSVSAQNHSTSDGTLYVDLLIPALWLIRFDGTGYAERHYYFNLINDTHTELTLYLINESLVSDVTALIIDEKNSKVEGAFLKVMRYDIGTNAYSTREIYKTNFEGEAQLNLILNDEFYKFIIEYPFGVIKKLTEPTYIYDTTLEIQILIGQAVGTNFFNSQGIDWSLTYNNKTDAFSYTYSDPNNLISEGCLRIYKLGASKETLVNESCVYAASSTIILKVSNETGTTYDARAFVGYSPPTYYLGSAMHTFLDYNPVGKMGLMMLGFITIVIAFIGFWSLSVMTILIPIPTLLLSSLGLIAIPIYAAISLQVIALIIVFMISKYS
jgi:hypothetical protein